MPICPSTLCIFLPRNMTGFPLILKIERAVTENFWLQIWIRDGRIDQGTFRYGNRGWVSGLSIWWAKKYSRLFFRLTPRRVECDILPWKRTPCLWARPSSESDIVRPRPQQRPHRHNNAQIVSTTTLVTSLNDSTTYKWTVSKTNSPMHIWHFGAIMAISRTSLAKLHSETFWEVWRWYYA